MLQTSQITSLGSEDTVQLKVTSVENLSSDVKVLTLASMRGEKLAEALPGSHIDIHLPNGMVRQYSLLNSGRELTSYQVAVKRMPNGGGGSIAVHDEVKFGATLTVSYPRNNFPLHEDGQRYLFIAGGIGITPIWSMLNRMERLGKPWELHYAVRLDQDVLFRDLLCKFGERIHIYTDHESPPTKLDLNELLKVTEQDVRIYCCGPAPMLQAFRELTTHRTAGYAVIEAFEALEDADRSGGFVVDLARSNRSLLVKEGQSILECLLEAGLDIPSSCRDGVCGTCETVVLGGIPDHRDAYLSPEEQQAGDRIMVCCSGCKGDRLILDI
jgi:tetrachlorobenzoquinone reductase